jgi:hypothetical protein
MAILQMGFSLELANAPLVNQSTIAPLESELITSYNISMKLGDSDNTLDGFVGYFKLGEDAHEPTKFDMSSFFSYFAPATASTTGDPSKPITNPFGLRPYYYLDPADPTWNSNEISFTNAQDVKRQVIAAIVDPLVSVHAYTEMLPTNFSTMDHILRHKTRVYIFPYGSVTGSGRCTGVCDGQESRS